MAQLRKPIHDDGPVNAGEKRLLGFLCVKLPDNYIVIPNLNISITGPNRVMKYWEYDCIVVAPHAVSTLRTRTGEAILKEMTGLGSEADRKLPIRTRQQA